MPFAQWLQRKMEQHGFTNYRIAKMAGVHQSTVSNWLTGSKPQAEKERMVRQAISNYEYNCLADSQPEPQGQLEGIKKAPAPEGVGVSKMKLLAALDGLTEEQCDKMLDIVLAAKKMM